MEEELEKDMTPRLIGNTFMKKPTNKSKYARKYGVFQCPYCTNTFEAMVSNIDSGGTRSCGCQINKQKITHGLSKHRLFDTWYGMITRCYTTTSKDYISYGGRGIIVCEEWLDVRNFIEWCESTHPNIEGLSLDRIDVNGNYEPSNCRWATTLIQNVNKRLQLNNKSGFAGVNLLKSGRWKCRISINKNRITLGTFLTIEEAVQARDNYIIENKLPHKLSTEY